MKNSWYDATVRATAKFLWVRHSVYILHIFIEDNSECHITKQQQ